MPTINRLFLGAALVGGMLGAQLPGLFGETMIQNAEQRGMVRVTRLGSDGAGLFFYNANGHIRAEVSVFPGGGLASFGLMNPAVDINPHVFIRTDGANPSPMVFFKNNKDQHRIDLGLDISDPNQNPYLVYFDRQGHQHRVFGTFPYLEEAGGNS